LKSKPHRNQLALEISNDLHLSDASGDRAGSSGGVPEMWDDPGAKNYRSRGRGAKRNAIVIAEILDRTGLDHPGATPGNGSCHSRTEHRFNRSKANRKMDRVCPGNTCGPVGGRLLFHARMAVDC